MRVVEPCGAFVVELCQRALAQDSRRFVIDGQHTIGEAGDDLGLMSSHLEITNAALAFARGSLSAQSDLTAHLEPRSSSAG